MEQLVIIFFETNSDMYMGQFGWCYSALLACRTITKFIVPRHSLLEESMNIYHMTYPSILASIYDLQLTKWDSDLL